MNKNLEIIKNLFNDVIDDSSDNDTLVINDNFSDVTNKLKDNRWILYDICPNKQVKIVVMKKNNVQIQIIQKIFKDNEKIDKKEKHPIQIEILKENELKDINRFTSVHANSKNIYNNKNTLYSRKNTKKYNNEAKNIIRNLLEKFDSFLNDIDYRETKKLFENIENEIEDQNDRIKKEAEILSESIIKYISRLNKIIEKTPNSDNNLKDLIETYYKHLETYINMPLISLNNEINKIKKELNL